MCWCQGKRANWRRRTDRGPCPFSRRPWGGRCWQPARRAPAPRPSLAVGEEQWSFSYVFKHRRKKYPQQQPQHSQVVTYNLKIIQQATTGHLAQVLFKTGFSMVHACTGRSRGIWYAGTSMRVKARNINRTLKEVVFMSLRDVVSPYAHQKQTANKFSRKVSMILTASDCTCEHILKTMTFLLLFLYIVSLGRVLHDEEFTVKAEQKKK